MQQKILWCFKTYNIYGPSIKTSDVLRILLKEYLTLHKIRKAINLSDFIYANLYLYLEE